MFRRILYVALLSLVCAPVFGQANVYNQLTRTAAETTDSADVWIPIWDQPATPRKSFKISVAELFKEPKAVVIASGTLTDSAPAIDISQTFNDGTEAFTAFKLNVTDTASAAGSKLAEFQVGGSSRFLVKKSGLMSSSTSPNQGGLRFNGTSVEAVRYDETAFSPFRCESLTLGTATSAQMYVDANDTLAQRNGTTAQKLSIYNTYTDGSNYERGVFDWKGTSNTLRIGTENAGTGVARDLAFIRGGVVRQDFDATFARISSDLVVGLIGSQFNFYVSSASNGRVGLAANSPLVWSSNATSANSAGDAGLARSAAAVVKVTDGSTGFGQLDAKRTTLTGGSVTTASAPLVDATQTWNDGAVTFTGFKQNITDTASGVSSLLFDWQVGGVSYLKLTKFGDLVGSAFTGTDFSIRMQNGSLKQGSSTITAWGSSNAAGTMDTALARGGAGIVKFTNASTGAGMIQLQEAGAAPSAPAADNVIIYAIDNGSGKTQLMALFSSGAAQQIAIQP